MEARSRNHCFRGKARSITYYECVCLYSYVSSMQSACVVFYFRLLPVRLYHVFTHYLVNSTILGNSVIEHKICVLVFSINLSERFLILRRIQRGFVINIHTYTHVFMQSFLLDFNQTWIFSADFRKKYSNIKFHENPSSGNRVGQCGRTDGQKHRQTWCS
jgi:hypothetical protein